MQGEEEEIRKTLNFYILFEIAPPLGAFLPREPPLLGEVFATSAGKLFDAIGAFRSTAVKDLVSIPLDQLRADFTDRGVPRTAERRKWCSQQRDDFKARFSSLTMWLLVLLDPDRTFAKYDYWSKAAFFSLDEVLWLSVGLQPLPEFIRALDHPSQRTPLGDAVAAHMVAQRELFGRSLDPNGFDRRQTAQAVLDWANLVQHELHPGFRRMLETMVQRKAVPEVSVVPVAAPSDAMPVGAVDPAEALAGVKVDVKRIDPRERLGMAKLLVAIAIEQFGYDPD